MSLNWSLAAIPDYKATCYQRVTREEAEAQGTTIEALTKGHSAAWYIPGTSDTEKLANCDVAERMDPLTHALIWAPMGIQMGSITEDNYGEFWARVSLMEKLSGPFLHRRAQGAEGWEPRPITLDEVKTHVGLKTNVSDEGWASWAKSRADTWKANLLRVNDLRAGPWKPPISQVAAETEEQLERLAKALRVVDIYGGDVLEQRIEDQVQEGLYCVDKAVVEIHRLEGAWEELEADMEEAELAESEGEE